MYASGLTVKFVSVKEMLSTSQRLTAEERKERKRFQNRLNQRARRQRVKDREADTTKLFWVERWRLGEDSSPSTQKPPHVVNSSEDIANDGQALRLAERPPSQHPTKISGTPNRAPPPLQPASTHGADLSLPADHALIRLITHNVCRGLVENKSILRLMASFINAVHNPPLPPDVAAGCSTVVLRTTHQTIPTGLLPTQLQMNSPHPSWMDILPFPEIRNNLIRGQYMFNHRSFLEDLVGDLIYIMPPRDPDQEGLMPTTCPRMNQRSQPTHNGNGLILWGEPYLKESWEASPQFLAKWAWAVEGCRDLVDVSNGWRTTRGEDLLQTSGSGQP
ncbi:hypothetical protein EDB81DRAFT_713027 [Dactylonectria macrodidyma]|uniref:BZIP domain-containing protein n=1 Tax=Dactylonectria macrodidyma TaxID=307937 RepID=A0A9P9JKE5_9HYPO|nr:hypothetical protein EDB81DRAFT_713027 [Dactylonectria macrodidyma]